MDAATLAQANVNLKRRVVRGQQGVAVLTDSLLAFGSTPGSIVLNLDASTSIGATSITVSNPYAAYPSQVAPTAGTLLVLSPRTANEEHVVIGAVTGTGPWNITVPALTKEHAAGDIARTSARTYDAKSVPMWMHILSNGRLRFAGVYGHGGYTAEQIKTVYLPQVIAAKPVACIVQAGTNPGTYTLQHINDHIIPMWETLLANGIQPIVSLLPPNNANASSSGYKVQRFNERLHREASRRGLSPYDTYNNLVDRGDGTQPGGWKLTYNADDVHPSEIGARAWAQGLVTLLDGKGLLLPSDLPCISTQRSNGDTATYPMSNSLNLVLLNDTNGDGIPDNWTGTKGQAGDTFALGTVPGIVGQALTITRAAFGTSDPIVRSPAWVGIPGNRYRARFKILTSGVDAAYDAVRTSSATATNSPFGGFDARLTNNNADTDNLFGLKTWKRDIPGVTTLDFEYVHPAGLTNNTIDLRLQLRGSGSTPAYSVTIGQFQVVNLTALDAVA